MNKIQVPHVVDVKTGEIIPFYLAKEKQIMDFIESKPNPQKSILLTQINAFKKFVTKFENTLKTWIKVHGGLQFDDKNHAMFEDWRISKSSRAYFNKEKFEQEASEEEKQVQKQWKEIETRYSEGKEIIKF